MATRAQYPHRPISTPTPLAVPETEYLSPITRDSPTPLQRAVMENEVLRAQNARLLDLILSHEDEICKNSESATSQSQNCVGTEKVPENCADINLNSGIIPPHCVQKQATVEKRNPEQQTVPRSEKLQCRSRDKARSTLDLRALPTPLSPPGFLRESYRNTTAEAINPVTPVVSPQTWDKRQIHQAETCSMEGSIASSSAPSQTYHYGTDLHNVTSTSDDSLPTPLEQIESNSVLSSQASISSSAISRVDTLCEDRGQIIRVEFGLIGKVPSRLRFAAGVYPCVLFAVEDLSTGIIEWRFVKSCHQLQRFDSNMRTLLTRHAKHWKASSAAKANNATNDSFGSATTGLSVACSSRIRPSQIPTLPHMPGKNLYSNVTPAKVDQRVDMLNAYFRRISEISVVIREDVELYSRFHRLMNALIKYDLVEVPPEPHQPYGFVMQRLRYGSWRVRYAVLNNDHLDIFDHPEGACVESIPLKKALLYRHRNFFDGTDDDERYLFTVEEAQSGREHRFSVESREVLTKWLDVLASAILALRDANSELSRIVHSSWQQGSYTPSAASILPYTIITQESKSPYLSLNGSGSSHLLSNLQSPQASQQSQVSEQHGAHKRHRPSYSSGVPAERQSPFSPTPVQSQNRLSTKLLHHNPRDFTRELPPPPSVSKSDTAARAGISSQQQERLLKLRQGRITKSHNPGPTFGVMVSKVSSRVQLGGVTVPRIVARCIDLLTRKNASAEEGIFRINGSQLLVDELESEFETWGDFDLLAAEVDIHSTAALLKRYIRKIPKPLMGEWSDFAHRENDPRGRVEKLRNLVRSLHEPERALLQITMKFLTKVARNEQRSRMGPKNLGIVLSPTIRMPGAWIASCIENYEAVFDENQEMSFNVREKSLPPSPI